MTPIGLGFFFLLMINAGNILLLLLLFFVFPSGFLSLFLSGNAMSHFIVLCDHSPQVSVVVLYDLLIGHCARVSLLASIGLCSVELTWIWKKKIQETGVAQQNLTTKRKSRAMRSLLPDFQIKQRTTAERVMILLVLFSHPQVYAMHMGTFLLTKASLCSVAWLTSKGVVKGSKMNSLVK